MVKESSHKSGQKRKSDEEELIYSDGEISEVEINEKFEETAEVTVARSPVRKLAKTVQEEMNEERESEDNLNQNNKNKSGKKDLLVNSKGKLSENQEDALKLRSRMVVKDKKVARNLNFDDKQKENNVAENNCETTTKPSKESEDISNASNKISVIAEIHAPPNGVQDGINKGEKRLKNLQLSVSKPAADKPKVSPKKRGTKPKIIKDNANNKGGKQGSKAKALPKFW